MAKMALKGVRVGDFLFDPRTQKIYRIKSVGDTIRVDLVIVCEHESVWHRVFNPLFGFFGYYGSLVLDSPGLGKNFYSCRSIMSESWTDG